MILADARSLAAVVTGRTGVDSRAGSLLRADALSAWMLLVVGAVALLAGLGQPRLPRRRARAGEVDGRDLRRYGILVHLFLAAMALAVLAGNLGVLWVAVEATTIVTAFLVGHHRTRARAGGGLEVRRDLLGRRSPSRSSASCCLLRRPARRPRPWPGALDWATLTGHAGELDPAVTRIAVALAGARIRRQGRPGPAARLAARRPLARRPPRSPR